MFLFPKIVDFIDIWKQNRHHKWKLIYETSRRQHLLSIYCYRGLSTNIFMAALWGSKSIQKLSEIEIFRKSKDFGLILIYIINMCLWCYIWCCKLHSIIVAHFQSKCCFSATNVDFSGFCTFIRIKIEIWMKKQHLLPKNNNFVENQQQWCYVVLHIIYSISTIRKPNIRFAQFFDSCFW